MIIAINDATSWNQRLFNRITASSTLASCFTRA
jgi:hypothetical protein